MLHELTKYEEAIAAYDASLKIKADNYRAFNNKGVALGKLGKYEEALLNYKAAVKIQPNLPAIYENLSITYIALDEKEQAVKSIEKFLELSPSFDKQLLNEMDELKALRDYPRFRALIDAP